MAEEEITNSELEQLKTLLNSDSTSGYGFPEPPSKESQFKFFKYLIDLLETTKSRKVGNLSEEELGNLPLSVRCYFDVANYCRAEGLDLVADYLERKGDIETHTSLSKKGFFVTMFNTQIKTEKKDKPKGEKKSWSLFNKPEQQAE